MNRIPFDPKELEPIEFLPNRFPNLPPIPVFRTPISKKENFMLLIRGEQPLWMPHIKEFSMLCPRCIPDNWARGTVAGATPRKYGGKDMFGVEWEYDPISRGSMVRPDAPLVPDLEQWERFVRFPDIETWDWAGSAAEAEEARRGGCIVKIPLMTGLFERLVSFIGMEEALVSLIDEDAKDCVHALLDRLCLLYDGIFAKMEQYLQPDLVWFHDDWGSQRSPLFSLDTVSEMLLPYLRRMVESAHRHGMIFEFHSCGMIEPLVPAMVEAGCDMWNGQAMNDKAAMARVYGDHLICDSFPPELPAGASANALTACIQQYLENFRGLRTYVGMHYTEHPMEYRLLYELSRKAFN